MYARPNDLPNDAWTMMRKPLIAGMAVAAAITFITAIPTVIIPMASANPYPCLRVGRS